VFGPIPCKCSWQFIESSRFGRVKCFWMFQNNIFTSLGQIECILFLHSSSYRRIPHDENHIYPGQLVNFSSSLEAIAVKNWLNFPEILKFAIVVLIFQDFTFKIWHFRFRFDKLNIIPQMQLLLVL